MEKNRTELDFTHLELIGQQKVSDTNQNRNQTENNYLGNG